MKGARTHGGGSGRSPATAHQGHRGRGAPRDDEAHPAPQREHLSGSPRPKDLRAISRLLRRHQWRRQAGQRLGGGASRADRCATSTPRGHGSDRRGTVTTSNVNWPPPRGLTINRPFTNGASVWAWQRRHSATSASRSQSAPPWERLTTWWTSRRPPRPQAWQRQPARAKTTCRMACHCSGEAVARPRARGWSGCRRRHGARRSGLRRIISRVPDTVCPGGQTR